MTTTSAKKEAAVHERFLRTADAAAFIGHAESTLRKWRMRGTGPRYCRAGKIVLYDTADLKGWLKSRSFTSTSEEQAHAA